MLLRSFDEMCMMLYVRDCERVPVWSAEIVFYATHRLSSASSHLESSTDA